MIAFVLDRHTFKMRVLTIICFDDNIFWEIFSSRDYVFMFDFLRCLHLNLTELFVYFFHILFRLN